MRSTRMENAMIAADRLWGKAMAVIRTDEEVSAIDQQELHRIRNILKVHRVFL